VVGWEGETTGNDTGGAPLPESIPSALDTPGAKEALAVGFLDVEVETAAATAMDAPSDPEGQLNPDMPDIYGELEEDGPAKIFGVLGINGFVLLDILVPSSEELPGREWEE
jgi:hypothetical protein